LVVGAEGRLVGKTSAEVRAGESQVTKGNVRLRQTQMILQHVRVRPRQTLEQLEADLGVAVLE